MNDARTYETVWLLRAAIRQYADAVRRALVDGGYGDIPTRGLWAIGAIRRVGGATHPSALVDELGVTKQAVSQLVELLDSLGYVQREGDPRDRRRHVIALTERGDRAASIMEDACAAVDQNFARRLGTQAALWVRLLQQLAGVENDEGGN